MEGEEREKRMIKRRRQRIGKGIIITIKNEEEGEEERWGLD